jgi:hypothetical protein
VLIGDSFFKQLNVIQAFDGVSPLLKHFVKLTFVGKKGSRGCGDDDGTLLEAKGEV